MLFAKVLWPQDEFVAAIDDMVQFQAGLMDKNAALALSPWSAR